MSCLSPHHTQSFIENASIGIHIVNSEGKVLWANKLELNLLGYDKDEYFEHLISDFHADEATISDILARLSRFEQLQDYPARLKAKVRN